MISEETLKEVTKKLVDSFHPEKVILFGSQARGTADEQSDIDILVICSVKDNRRDLILNMYRAIDVMSLPTDILVLTPKEFELDRLIPGTIARPAWLEGKILYERN